MNKLRFTYKHSDFNFTVTYEMVQQTKCYIIKKKAQHSEFLQEIIDFKRGGSVAKSSRLYKLNDNDDHEILICNGRVKRLNNHEDEIVLPPEHISYNSFFDEDYYHHFHEAVIKKYKKVCNSCQKFKNSSAAQPAQMAQLPVARLGAFQRPFAFVGIDFFDPLLVTVGRKKKNVVE